MKQHEEKQDDEVRKRTEEWERDKHKSQEEEDPKRTEEWEREKRK